MTRDPFPNLVAFDFETHLIRPGNLQPRLVCGTFDDGEGAVLLAREDAIELAARFVQDPSILLGGANVFYDLGVLVKERPELLKIIFRAIDEERIVDTHLLEVLHDIATGTAYRDGAAEIKRYSLNLLERRHLGIDRSDAKYGENAWRLRSSELDGVPLEKWPRDAILYPLDDARLTRRILVKQLQEEVRVPQVHDLSFGPPCIHCGATDAKDGDPCVDFVIRRHNLRCLADEMRAAWWLHLSACEGLRTDAEMVPVVVGEWRRAHEENRKKFFEAGIVRVKPCSKEEIEKGKADDISAEWLRAVAIHIEASGGWEDSASWQARRLLDIDAALRSLERGRPIRFAEDKARLKELVVAAYKGNPPMTAGGKVSGPATSTARDTLGESGDELLEEYGESGPVEKELSTYARILEQGTVAPINPGISYCRVTQRVSYWEPNLQNLPRKGKTRECFIPPPGSVFCSMDYSGIELCTLAQICFSLFGASAMRDALNAGQDLHTRMAARIAGISYDEAMTRRKTKDRQILNLRQTSKPINFGKPGLMGPPKMVFTARKDGVVFCDLAGRGPCRSHERVTEYKGRAISPTCCECLALAVEYSDLWYAEWPEMRDYHDVTCALAEQCADGEPAESFGTGLKRLETGANAVSNHFFQNLAAQGAKWAGWLLASEAYTDEKSVLFGRLRLGGFIHDEQMTSIVEDEHTTACAWRASEILREGMKRFVPDVRVTIEPAIMRRWFKGAEKIEDASGNLVPWWPDDWLWPGDLAAMARDRSRIAKRAA